MREHFCSCLRAFNLLSMRSKGKCVYVGCIIYPYRTSAGLTQDGLYTADPAPPCERCTASKLTAGAACIARAVGTGSGTLAAVAIDATHRM